MSTIEDRIRALLRLSESSNINEAAAAAYRAEQLCAQYRVEAHTIAEEPPSTVHVSEELKFHHKWERVLVNRLAQHYGVAMCFWARTATTAATITLVGLSADIHVLLAMFRAVKPQVARLLRQIPNADPAYRFSYAYGVIAAIIRSLNRAESNVLETKPTSVALALRSQLERSKEELFRAHPSLTSEREHSRRQRAIERLRKDLHGEAIGAGLVVGRSVDITVQKPRLK